MNNFSWGLTFGLCGAAVVVVQPAMVRALSVNEIKEIAKEITVVVEGQDQPGSGVIIAKDGDVYYVLTARHVIDNTNSDEEAWISTYDGKKHRVNMPNVQKLPNNIDLAVVEFTSTNVYSVATLSGYQDRLYENRDYRDNVSHSKQQPVYVFVSGTPHGSGWKFHSGTLYDNSASAISNPNVTNPEENFRGYELVYSNLTYPGMSGGPVLDGNGRVIGIHGRADGKVLNENQQVIEQYLDEVDSLDLPLNIKIGFSTAIPIKTFLSWAQTTGMSSTLTLENTPPEAVSQVDVSSSWTPDIKVKNQDNPLYWLEIGNQLWRLNRYEEAIQAFDQAIARDSDLYLAWFAKAFALGFNQEYDRALGACERALQLDSEDYDALRCKAGAAMELGKYDVALEALNEALEINGNNAADWATQGELYMSVENYAAALNSFDKAIAMRQQQGLPPSPVMLNNKGVIFLVMQNYSQALPLFEEATIIDPNYPKGWSNKGFALSLLNRHEESLQAYDQAVRLDPNDKNTWNNRGLTLYFLNRKEEALESFEKALEIDRNYQPAWQNRNDLLQELG